MRNVSRRFGVTCRLQTPLRSPVSLWAFHTGIVAQFVFAFHVLQEGQHHTKLVHDRGRHALRAVFRVKAFDALVNDVPYLRVISVA